MTTKKKTNKNHKSITRIIYLSYFMLKKIINFNFYLPYGTMKSKIEVFSALKILQKGIYIKPKTKNESHKLLNKEAFRTFA